MSEPPTPETDTENQWDDDPHDEVVPPPPQSRKRGCNKWTWAAITVLVAILVIVPLTVVSVNKSNTEKAKAAAELGDLYSPVMAPAVTDSAGEAPAMAAPSIAEGAAAETVIPTAVPNKTPTGAPTMAPLTCGSDTQLVCPVNSTSNTTEWVQVANDIIGEAAGDLSGFQIAMSCDGSIVAIGAGQNDGNGDRAGHVRVYRFNSTDWEQLGSDIDGEAELDWFGYSVSLASDGLRMAVGARYNDNANGNNTGSVRVYDYVDSSGDWAQIGQDILGEADGDQSGRAVALSADGTKVAIGASANDGSGSDAGHVRIYELSGAVWSQLGGDIDGEAAEDSFGRAVALSLDGMKIVVGGYANDEAGMDAGHVQIYELVSGNWTQIGTDIEGTEAGDWAGLTVDISAEGNRVVVGAPGNNDRFLPGLSQVYELDDVSGDWTQLGEDLAGGYAVSLSEDGNRVAVGDYKGNTEGINSGHVYVYQYDGSTWFILGSEIDGVEGELSGTSVALSADGQRVAISSPVYTDPTIGEEVGATRVYDLC